MPAPVQSTGKQERRSRKESGKTAALDMGALLDRIFLTHQADWIRDKTRIKLWEKSRRIGGTFSQSFEDVADCVGTPGTKVYFSSADLTAASEYGDYIDDWATKFNAASAALADLDEHETRKIPDMLWADEEKGLRSRVKEFSNGSKIILLSSNPKAFRSKGGKIVWDEAAWHDQAEKMWAAASPAIMWGHALRILSTHNGPNSVFNQLAVRAKEGISGWSVHTTTIRDAAFGGLVAKILRRDVSPEEIEAWIQEQRALCLTESEWLQEYLCSPQDESTALIPYAALAKQSRPDLLQDIGSLLARSGPLFIGYDVARRRHLSVCYILEGGSPALTVRHLEVMEKLPFAEQQKILWPLFRLPQVQRICIDATGIGAMIAESAKDEFGSFRVEELDFTAPLKEHLAVLLQREFDDGTVWIPGDLPEKESAQQKEGIHSVRKFVTAAGHSRYDAPASEKNGHGDHFWALALAVHAARNKNVGPARGSSRSRTVSIPGIPGSFSDAIRRFGRVR